MLLEPVLGQAPGPPGQEELGQEPVLQVPVPVPHRPSHQLPQYEHHGPQRSCRL